MRRSRSTKFLVENDVFFGITLEADFTAEHEFGIKGITRAFKIPREDFTKVGIERYTINDISTNLSFLKKGKRKITEALLYFSYYDSIENQNKYRQILDSNGYPLKEFIGWNELNSWKDPMEATSAWDENSFAVRGSNQDEANKLEEVYNAFLAGDIAIWVGGGGPFHAGGMHLIIKSKMPSHIGQMLWLEHAENNRLLDAVEKMGVEADLKAAGKKWFALSPKFTKDEQGNEVIRFWLNPMDQQNNNFGWFSEEELRQWIKDEGPIPGKVKA